MSVHGTAPDALTAKFNDMSGIGRGGHRRTESRRLGRCDPDSGTHYTLGVDETFDIGADTGTPVDDRDYQVPFAFTGKIDRLTIALDPPKLTPHDVQGLEAPMSSAEI